MSEVRSICWRCRLVFAIHPQIAKDSPSASLWSLNLIFHIQVLLPWCHVSEADAKWHIVVVLRSYDPYALVVWIQWLITLIKSWVVCTKKNLIKPCAFMQLTNIQSDMEPKWVLSWKKSMVIDLCNNQNKEQIVRWIWNMKNRSSQFQQSLTTAAHGRV